jgi:hypothetical protein
MSTAQVQKSESLLSKRRVGFASVAAFLGCAACCAMPLLAAAGFSSGAVATLSSVVRPGAELFVGGAVFAIALGMMAVRQRVTRKSDCNTICKSDGSCCDRRASKNA